MTDVGLLEFKECPQCAAKPGSPALCESCVWNRWLVQQLKAALASYRQGAEAAQRIEGRIAAELGKRRII